jgi:hypothetical protein
MDLNHRRRPPTDLQSAAIDRSATDPHLYPSHQPESNQRPTVYKTAALPAELWWHIFKKPRKIIPFIFRCKYYFKLSIKNRIYSLFNYNLCKFLIMITRLFKAAKDLINERK